MSVVFVDGATVIDFVNDAKLFEKSIDEHFKMLDDDGNEELSRDAMQRRSGKLASGEYDLQSRDEIKTVYDAVFEKFDVDRNGVIDRKEFRELMKEIMLAKGRGIGIFQVPLIVQEDSLLMRAVKHRKN